MCGICGVINLKGLTKHDLDYFTEVLKKSTPRGTDASGVAVQSLSYTKSSVPSTKLVKTDQININPA